MKLCNTPHKHVHKFNYLAFKVLSIGRMPNVHLLCAGYTVLRMTNTRLISESNIIPKIYS